MNGTALERLHCGRRQSVTIVRPGDGKLRNELLCDLLTDPSTNLTQTVEIGQTVGDCFGDVMSLSTHSPDKRLANLSLMSSHAISVLPSLKSRGSRKALTLSSSSEYWTISR